MRVRTHERKCAHARTYAHVSKPSNAKTHARTRIDQSRNHTNNLAQIQRRILSPTRKHRLVNTSCQGRGATPSATDGGRHTPSYQKRKVATSYPESSAILPPGHQEGRGSKCATRATAQTILCISCTGAPEA